MAYIAQNLRDALTGNLLTGKYYKTGRRDRRFQKFRRRQRRTSAISRTRGGGYLRRGGYYGRFEGGGELKFHDVPVTGVVSTAGLIFPSLNLILQDTGESERIGRRITITNIGFRLHLLHGSETNAGLTDDTVRLIVYQDKQCNGAAATPGQILEGAGFQSFNNLENKSRFRTLMDRTYSMSQNGAAGDTINFITGEIGTHDEWYKKCNLTIEYGGTAAVITNVRSNNIGLLAISQNARCNLEGLFRLRYSDA